MKAKAQGQTSNPSPSPIPLDTPAKPADFNQLDKILGYLIGMEYLEMDIFSLEPWAMDSCEAAKMEFDQLMEATALPKRVVFLGIFPNVHRFKSG